ncbi:MULTISPECIES: cytochrome b [Halomonadaceae]|jgi:cytochrome b561|uniref:Cytochrome b561 n=2 Tax=Vreelandella TaxID=3137766 RepID=A0A1H9RC62_9GAMM|nr:MULTISPECIES: cytochrome b [Halomonas]MCO7248128.1 cytochrome b [Halomonas sp. Mc5H-6]MDR5873737.1 cytochrome b [Halomonas gomseomensis]QPL44929.1 cytochrome b [Halomonas sp. A40-4]SER70217.1 cytochrome b561 [Halomonas subterranea]
MAINDSQKYYGSVSRLLHWITALLVTLQLASAYMNNWQPGNAFSQLFQPWHATVGFMILALVGLRIVWLLFQIRNRPPHQGKAVLIGHLSIYALLVAAPVSGLLQGFGIRLFDHLVSKGIGTPFAEASQAIHGPIAYLLTVLIAGHVFMALFHHWVHRDGTLYRMVGQAKS